MSKNSKARRNQPQPVTATETVTQERPASIDNGNDARGDVNARGNQTATQPEPEPAIVALGDTVVSMRPPKGVRGSIFEERRETLSEAGKLKVMTEQKARQRAAEAADLMREGGEKAKEGKRIAAEVATLLYSARAANAMAAEQVSAILGDTFGYKKKGGGDAPIFGASDPDASKTPFGEGEAIRKRVVRAVQAKQFVDGGEASNFFDGLPKQEVADVLQRVEGGDLSIYSAYDMLGTIKRENAEKVHPAFDPKAVAKTVEALREPGAANRFLENPTLVDAYLALRDMLVEIDREAAAIKREAA